MRVRVRREFANDPSLSRVTSTMCVSAASSRSVPLVKVTVGVASFRHRRAAVQGAGDETAANLSSTSTTTSVAAPGAVVSGVTFGASVKLTVDERPDGFVETTIHSRGVSGRSVTGVNVRPTRFAWLRATTPVSTLRTCRW